MGGSGGRGPKMRPNQPPLLTAVPLLEAVLGPDGICHRWVPSNSGNCTSRTVCADVTVPI